MSEVVGAQSKPVDQVTAQRSPMSSQAWSFFRIALLVTGKGEGRFLPRLFRSL